jgi:HAD superfamily hydrolase (TIGR01509 family)
MNKDTVNTIRWILFDVSGVIVHFTFQNPQEFTVGTRFFSQKELMGFFYTKEYDNYMLGLISHEQCVRKYLKNRKLDLSIAEFDELIKKDIPPMEGMKLLIQKLEKKYKIGLATNEGKMVTKYKIEGSGILPYLSKVIPSYLLREVKPSPLFFKKMLKIIGATADECIFIDDKPENINGARSLGITSILFHDAQQLEKELNVLQLL